MQDKDHLYILWTNGDPVTAEKMVFMYALNSLKKGWWSEVTVIVWGAAATLIAENESIQASTTKLLSSGVHVTACKACADQLGVTHTLEGLGIEVIYWGEPLTSVIKSGYPLLTV
jgi:hypothetical protein